MMNRSIHIVEATVCLCLIVSLAGCGKKAADDKSGTGPAAVTVVPDIDPNNFQVDHPEQFPLVTAGSHDAAPELNVTGVVNGK